MAGRRQGLDQPLVIKKPSKQLMGPLLQQEFYSAICINVVEA